MIGINRSQSFTETVFSVFCSSLFRHYTHLEILSYLNTILNGKLIPRPCTRFNYPSLHCRQNKIIIAPSIETIPERSCDGIWLPIACTFKSDGLFRIEFQLWPAEHIVLWRRITKKRFHFRMCLVLCPLTSRASRKEKS